MRHIIASCQENDMCEADVSGRLGWGGVYEKGLPKYLGILQFEIAISRQQRNEREKNESERERKFQINISKANYNACVGCDCVLVCVCVCIYMKIEF